MTPDMAVVTPLNNFLGPEGDTVTVDEQLLNTEYCGNAAQAQAGVRVRRPFGARGRSSVRYGTRLGDLEENWFLLFSN